MAIGAPACGANAAIRAFVRTSTVNRVRVYGYYGSMAGMADDNIKELHWSDVHGWSGKGGNMLGTKRYEKIRAIIMFSHGWHH